MTKVLIIDDEEAIRFVFHRFLTDAGYEVSLAGHEIDARKFLSSHRFDVAVVDRLLPGGSSGLALKEEINRTQPECEVIMMSGLPIFELAAEASCEEGQTYLTKPVKKDVIIQAVKEAAEKSKTKRLM
ncbi:Response regulator receiver domain protein,histidine kinase (fragment) [uncultured Desulfobacterium sp.]|uniref:Response regulator receiver domain protein,histidine kinase n=1 Tax=uncultured Desulfobacterium sp. TaxID=201089 RepID=A0A445MWW1_9BACT